jgi:TrmH family RNA methyltransferase
VKLLTLARDLRRRKARERQGLFVAEGVRTVEELLRSPLAIRGALSTPPLRESPRGADLWAALERKKIPILEVGEADFDSAAETESPQGILAIAEVPERGFANVPDTQSLRLLVLDAVQDPGNVGTIIRTATALGAAATVALPGTVDLWNAKVVRSGMGAHFHHLCFSGVWEDVEAFCRDRGLAIWASDAAGEALDRTTVPSKLALIVGNEGSGLSSLPKSRADRVVALPIAGTVDSLNVAVAAGILLYELRP